MITQGDPRYVEPAEAEKQAQAYVADRQINSAENQPAQVDQYLLDRAHERDLQMRSAALTGALQLTQLAQDRSTCEPISLIGAATQLYEFLKGDPDE